MKARRGKGIPLVSDLDEREFGIDRLTSKVYLRNQGEVVEVGDKPLTVDTRADIPDGLPDGTIIFVTEE